MKKRQGFVSNSSSSSFVIRKDLLTREQIMLIKNHMKKGLVHDYGIGENDEWTIEESVFLLRGRTWMDNFDMQRYFKLIGIKETQQYFDGENDGDWL